MCLDLGPREGIQCMSRHTSSLETHLRDCASYSRSAECFSRSSPPNPTTKTAFATPNKLQQDEASGSTDDAAPRREHALHAVNGKLDAMARSPVKLVGGTRRLSNVATRNGRERGKL